MMGDSSPLKRLDSKNRVVRVAKRHGDDDGDLPRRGGDNESKGLLWLSSAPFQDSGRKKLMSHRDDVAGRVAIPDSWGQENLLRDWIDHTTFDSMLPHKRISSAREALMAEGRRPSSSQRLRIESSC